VPWGFFTVAIALRLTSLGLSPAGIGDLMFVASLPWAGKPVIGLLVDRLSFGRLGRRRPFILLAEVGMALSLLAMAFANPISDRPLFSALLFLHNLLAAAQDVGTDALAIDLLAESERSRANGIMSAGKFAGVVLGGQGLLWVAGVAGWPAAFAVAIALLLVPATLVLGVRESPLPAQRPAPFRPCPAGFFQPSRADRSRLCADRGPCRQFHLSPHLPAFSQSTWLFRTAGGDTGHSWWNRGRAGLALGGRSRRSPGLPSHALRRLSGRGGNQFWILRVPRAVGPLLLHARVHDSRGIAVGVVYATTLALFMNLTNPRVAATQFQIYMSLLNIKDAWAQKLGGRLAERIPAPAMFGLSAMIEVLPLLLLPWLDARRAQADFARDKPPAAKNTG